MKECFPIGLTFFFVFISSWLCLLIVNRCGIHKAISIVISSFKNILDAKYTNFGAICLWLDLKI